MNETYVSKIKFPCLGDFPVVILEAISIIFDILFLAANQNIKSL